MRRALDYPLTLDLSGLRILIAGGGAVGLQKLRGLPKGLASVTVISPRFLSAFKPRAGLSLKRRKVRLSDVDAADLIFAATDDSAVNTALAKRARAKRRLVSVADAPAAGNFAVPAVAKAGRIRITISTGGSSPAVAKALRIWIEARLKGSRLLKLTEELRRRRAWLKANPAEKAKRLEALRDPRRVKGMLQ